MVRQLLTAVRRNCDALGSESPLTAESLDAEALNRIEDAHSLTQLRERFDTD